MNDKPFRPGGVNPALVTPFGPDQSVDEDACRRLIRHVLPHVDGLVHCGTTGEFNYLTPEENRRLVEIAVEEAGHKPVIAGTGAAGTRLAIDLARGAQEAGATACLIVTPYFLHPSDKGIYQHYHEIATALPEMPIILYNIPQVVDAYLPRRVVQDLADLPNIVGLKDSSGNLTYTMEILEYAGDRINVLIGHDEVVLNALAGGASGMILASAQVYPEIWQAVLAAVRKGDLDTARTLQRQVQKLSRIFCRYGGGVAVKQALKMMGVNAGRPRLPLKPVGGALVHEDRAEIRMELEKLGKIEVAPLEFEFPKAILEERFGDLELDAGAIKEAALRLGTGKVGEEPEWVQLDLVAGSKDSPLGDSYAYQLTSPLHRREALTTILEPNLTVRPATLILPAVEQRNLRQANMIYGPTQSAVARAIVDALEAGTIPQAAMEDEVMVVMASVDPRALDRHALYHNVREAMATAIGQAFGAGG